jgi:hypothetical protein
MTKKKAKALLMKDHGSYIVCLPPNQAITLYVLSDPESLTVNELEKDSDSAEKKATW